MRSAGFTFADALEDGCGVEVCAVDGAGEFAAEPHAAMKALAQTNGTQRRDRMNMRTLVVWWMWTAQNYMDRANSARPARRKSVLFDVHASDPLRRFGDG